MVKFGTLPGGNYKYTPNIGQCGYIFDPLFLTATLFLNNF